MQIVSFEYLRFQTYRYEKSPKEYISDLIESIMMSFGVDKDAFHLHLDITVTELDVDALGLIINEWVTNAFKHAYKMSKLEPALWIRLNLHVGCRNKFGMTAYFRSDFALTALTAHFSNTHKRHSHT